jgi:TPR repeat protein
MNLPRTVATIAALTFLAFSGITNAATPDEEAMSLAGDAVENFRYDLALAHYRKAAELGNVHARRTAGMMLLYGEAIYPPQGPANSEEGIRLLQQAASQGCRISQFVLARLNRRS